MIIAFDFDGTVVDDMRELADLAVRVTWPWGDYFRPFSGLAECRWAWLGKPDQDGDDSTEEPDPSHKPPLERGHINSHIRTNVTGWPSAIRDAYWKTIGHPFRKQLDLMNRSRDPVDPVVLDALADIYESQKDAITLAAPAWPDLRGAIDILDAEGHELVIVSSTRVELILRWLSEHELDATFTRVFGVQDGGKFLTLAWLRPDWFVGDADADDDYAAAVGCGFAAVQRGHYTKSNVYPDLYAVARRLIDVHA